MEDTNFIPFVRTSATAGEDDQQSTPKRARSPSIVEEPGSPVKYRTMQVEQPVPDYGINLGKGMAVGQWCDAFGRDTPEIHDMYRQINRWVHKLYEKFGGDKVRFQTVLGGEDMDENNWHIWGANIFNCAQEYFEGEGMARAMREEGDDDGPTRGKPGNYGIITTPLNFHLLLPIEKFTEFLEMHIDRRFQILYVALDHGDIESVTFPVAAA